jgi:hypothetical protein
MEFVLVCILAGGGFVLLSHVASRVFLDKKDRRDERKLQNR